MRTRNTITNILFAFSGQFIGIITSLIARQIFIRYLSAEYLGLSGLFSNLLSMLSLVELGVGPAMAFSLYKPLANDAQNQIKSLMKLYQKIYILIGSTIILLGICTVPIYRIFLNKIPSIPHLDLIYFMFVINTGISYFYSYKRTLIISDQKKYISTIYRYSFYAITNLIQSLILICSKNYIFFLAVQICFTWAENYSLSRKADKLYPYLCDKKIDRLDTQTLKEITKNIKAMIFHKIGGIVVKSTDNIILSKFLGLYVVGLYSNYYLVINALEIIIAQIFNSLIASVGNLNTEANFEKMEEVFKIIYFIGFWIYGYISICVLLLINPFIALWLGEEYLLSFSTVIVLVLNLYIYGMLRPIRSFKDATGNYYADRYKPIFEAIINLIASIILVKYLGITGVFLGTIISSMTTCFWIEPLVVYKKSFNSSVKVYFIQYIKYAIIAIVATCITFIFSSFFKHNTIFSFALQVIIYTVIINTIFIMFFYKSTEFKYIYNLIKNIKKNLI